MSEKMNMSVSEIVKADGLWHIYVLFSDGDRQAEGVLPEGKMISNNGFDKGELEQLRLYMICESNSIREMAKKVNVMDAFLS